MQQRLSYIVPFVALLLLFTARTGAQTSTYEVSSVYNVFVKTNDMNPGTPWTLNGVTSSAIEVDIPTPGVWTFEIIPGRFTGNAINDGLWSVNQNVIVGHNPGAITPSSGYNGWNGWPPSNGGPSPGYLRYSVEAWVGRSTAPGDGTHYLFDNFQSLRSLTVQPGQHVWLYYLDPSYPNDNLGGVTVRVGPAKSRKLVVSDWANDRILCYDGTTGAFLKVLVPSGSGGLLRPQGVATGPDGNLYVSSSWTNEVLRYDGQTGAFLDVFVTAGSGGLSSPLNLVFGPDGNLYVASYFTSSVLRYDGRTGASLGTFASGGGLSGCHNIMFRGDGFLYATGAGNGGPLESNNIVRYIADTGQFYDTFIPAGSGPIDTPIGMQVMLDGSLLVACYGSNAVLRYDGGTGEFLNVFASSDGLSSPSCMLFGPDGYLYVASWPNNTIRRHDPVTGAFLGNFLGPTPAPSVQPTYFLFYDNSSTSTPALITLSAKSTS